MSDFLDGAHNLDTLTCACGQPSGHESGACWDCYHGKHYPTDPRGQQDAGTPRVDPCRKRTWCILEEHLGSCHEVPRSKLETTDFGPARTTGTRAP